MCGKQEDIYNYEDPLGHDYRENTYDRVEPTEVKDGKATYVCYRCNDSYSEILPALGYEIINQTGYRILAPERIHENETVQVQFYGGPSILAHYFWVENATMTDLKLDTMLEMAYCNISNPTGTVIIH
jgi:hypothetical protein